MAKIGSISLTINGKLDSGLAQLLVKPPKKSHELNHNGAIFRASPDTLFGVCLFEGANSHEEAISIGSTLIQECLDLLSMTGDEDLATKNSSEEYIVWWATNGVSTISYNSTVTLSFSVGNPTLKVHDKDGKIVSPTIRIPSYHEAFRFYRLSQVSDDLFDSYRNMYLAFESLLSSKYPKGKGKEEYWLRVSLNNAEPTLQLKKFIPAGTSSYVDYLIDTIYKNARLPLFHAKDGKTKFIPTKPSDRKIVNGALSILTKIVIQMADVWYNCHRKSGGFNLKYYQEFNKMRLANCNIVFSDNPKFTTEDDLDSESIKEGYRFSGQYYDQFLGEDRPNVNGLLEVSLIKNRGPLLALFVVNDNSTQMVCSVESPVDLESFDRFETFFFLRGENANQPKSFFPR